MGRNTWITSISQPFSNQKDLLLGNTAGGLEYLKFDAGVIPPVDREFLVKIYPNPSIGNFKILVSQKSKARLVSILGQIIWDELDVSANNETEIQGFNLAPGVYILQLTNEKGQRLSNKIVIRK
jgi:hypothetical protein